MSDIEVPADLADLLLADPAGRNVEEDQDA